jgi:hypothetical protein
MSTLSTLDKSRNHNDDDNRDMKDDDDDDGKNKDQVILLDSLPYIESIHDDYEEYALGLIEEEMKRMNPRTIMKELPPLRFRTSLLKHEYQALELVPEESTGIDHHQQPQQPQQWVVRNSQRSSQDNHQMYQPAKILPPPSTSGKEVEWESCHALSQMKSRYESERLRGIVLDVQEQEDVLNWKDYNNHLDQCKIYWTRILQERNDAVEEINFQRQQKQTQQVKPELDLLVQEYQQILYQRNQLEYMLYSQQVP